MPAGTCTQAFVDTPAQAFVETPLDQIDRSRITLMPEGPTLARLKERGITSDVGIFGIYVSHGCDQERFLEDVIPGPDLEPGDIEAMLAALDAKWMAIRNELWSA